MKNSIKSCDIKKTKGINVLTVTGWYLSEYTSGAQLILMKEINGWFWENNVVASSWG